jgi:hypothetical protein
MSGHPQLVVLISKIDFRFISGSIHNFRVLSADWNDRFRKIRAGGFNAVQVQCDRIRRNWLKFGKKIDRKMDYCGALIVKSDTFIKICFAKIFKVGLNFGRILKYFGH